MTKFIAIDEANKSREATALFDMKVNDNNYLIFYISRDENKSNIFALKKDNNNYTDINSEENKFIKEIISSYIKNEFTPDVRDVLIDNDIKFNIKQDYIATTNNEKLDLIKLKEAVNLNLIPDVVQRIDEESDTLLVVDYDYREAIKKSFNEKTDLNDLDNIINNIKSNYEETPIKNESYSYGFINYKILGLISIVSFIASSLFLIMQINLYK